jgi:hypothetical protein
MGRKSSLFSMETYRDGRAGTDLASPGYLVVARSNRRNTLIAEDSFLTRISNCWNVSATHFGSLPSVLNGQDALHIGPRWFGRLLIPYTASY